MTWRRGKLVLVDHDLAAEEAAVALGSPPPPCVDVLRMWRQRALWAAVSKPDAPGFRRRRVRPPAIAPDLARVRELGVVRSWEREAVRHPDAEEREDIYRYLRKRALAPLLSAAGAAQAAYLGGRVSFAEIRMGDAGKPVEVVGRVDPRQTALVVTLTGDWLRSVWARGIGEVSGTFVVGVRDATAWPMGALVDAVTWTPVDDAIGAWEPVVAAAEVSMGMEGYTLAFSA